MKTNKWVLWLDTDEQQRVPHESLDESVSETTINILSSQPQWKQEILVSTTSCLSAGDSSASTVPLPASEREPAEQRHTVASFTETV